MYRIVYGEGDPDRIHSENIAMSITQTFSLNLGFNHFEHMKIAFSFVAEALAHLNTRKTVKLRAYDSKYFRNSMLNLENTIRHLK